MNQDSRKILSDNVRKLRTAKKLTREQLSLVLGFENSYISKIEKCKINITLERLDKIALFFEIDTFELLK